MGREFGPDEELQFTIIAGLVGMDTPEDEIEQRVRYAQAKLRPEYFSGMYAAIWQSVSQYFRNTGSTPTPGDFQELLAFNKDLSLSRRAEYSTLYNEMAATDITFARLKFSITTLAERWRHDELMRILGDAQQINVGSLTDESQSLSGYDDAMHYLAENLPRVQRTQDDQLQEGNINREMSEMLREYDEAKNGSRVGIMTGFGVFDNVTNGLHPGEMMLVAGFTGEGKSQTTYNIAYRAAYVEGRNVIFGSAEVSRAEVRRHLAVRHSHHPKFGKPEGIKYDSVKNGTLSEPDEMLWRAVLADMEQGSYGEMYVFPIPHKERVSYIEAKLQETSREFPVDLVVVDYLGLLGSRNRPNHREELNDVLIASKRLATDANGGRGVVLVSPWQISRSAWELAKETSEYTKTALAETSEAERSPDLVLSILRSDSAGSLLNAQILKNRDGAEGERFDLYMDASTCLVSDNGMYSPMFQSP